MAESTVCTVIIRIRFYTADNPISPKETYDAVIAEGIHPWVGAGAVTEEQILRGAEYGGELLT